MVELEVSYPLLGKRFDMVCGFFVDISAQLDVVKQTLILVSHDNMRSEEFLGV